MSGSIIRAAVIGLMMLIVAGCVTPINWQARVGVYTYDQAVMDYGPPMGYAKLSDGSIVVQWMTERGEVVMAPQPYFYGPGVWGPVWGGYSTSYFPARFLRLQFGPDGKLKTWKVFSK